MAARSDATTDRVYFSGTLPNPATTGLTIMGWYRLRSNTGQYQTYWRTSSGGPTINTVATGPNSLGTNVFTPSGNLFNTYGNVVDEWVHIATVDDNGSVTHYVTPFGGSPVTQTGSLLTGIPDQICLFGRSITDDTEFLNGAAAYVRVFAGKLNSSQVAAERNSTTAVMTAWADWPLSTGIDLNDMSGNGRHLTSISTPLSTESGPALESSLILGQVSESDISFSLVLGKLIPLNLVAESDISAATTQQKSLGLTLNSESDAALDVFLSQSVNITMAVESDISLQPTLLRSIILQLLQEIDQSFQVNIPGLAVVRPSISSDSIISIIEISGPF